jgi:hypothetical protein
MGDKLQRYIKSPLPGWFTVLAGAAWEALVHYEKVERVVPLPPRLLLPIGILWVILAKWEKKRPGPQSSSPGSSEVMILRERVTTVERELVIRREA